MLNQILKLGVLIATGRFLKPRLKGLAWIVLVWLLLWYAHSEYVQYVELSGDTSFVLKAALIKTALYALSIGVYVLLVERPLWPRPVKMPPPQHAVQTKTATTPTSGSASAGGAKPPAGDDGFDFLRHKEKLRSPAEEIQSRKK